MAYLTQLFERGKALPAAEIKYLMEEERKMREESEGDPSKALYYNILCRAYLSSEKNAKALGIKLTDWHLEQDKEKKIEEKNIDEKKMEGKKIEEEKIDQKKMEQEEKASTDKAGDTTRSGMHCPYF